MEHKCVAAIFSADVSDFKVYVLCCKCRNLVSHYVNFKTYFVQVETCNTTRVISYAEGLLVFSGMHSVFIYHNFILCSAEKFKLPFVALFYQEYKHLNTLSDFALNTNIRV